MKISDKLTKVDENFTINKYDNGYMVEVGGRDDEDNWASVKLIATSLDVVIEMLKDFDSIQKTS